MSKATKSEAKSEGTKEESMKNEAPKKTRPQKRGETPDQYNARVAREELEEAQAEAESDPKAAERAESYAKLGSMMHSIAANAARGKPPSALVMKRQLELFGTELRKLLAG